MTHHTTVLRSGLVVLAILGLLFGSVAPPAAADHAVCNSNPPSPHSFDDSVSGNGEYWYLCEQHESNYFWEPCGVWALNYCYLG